MQIIIDEYNTLRGESEGVEYQSLSQSMLVDPACGDLPKCVEVIPELRDRVLEAIAEQKAEVEQRYCCSIYHFEPKTSGVMLFYLVLDRIKAELA